MKRACLTTCFLLVGFSSVGLSQSEPRVDNFGDPLPKYAVARIGSVRFKHSEAALGLTWAPKGSVLVSGGWDGIRVWDGATGKLIRSVVLNRGRACFGAAFSPDGSKLATVHEGGKVRLWSYPSFESLFDVSAHYGAWVTGVAFAPNGELFASAGRDGDVCVWKVGSEFPVHRLDIDREAAGGVSFSPDSKRVAADGKKDLYVWDVESGDEIVKIENAHGLSAASVLCLPDGSLLSGGIGVRIWREDGKRKSVAESQVFQWDANTGEQIHSYAATPIDKGSAAFVLSADSKVLATTHYRRIRLWDLASRKQIRDWPVAKESYRPHAMAFSPDGKHLAAVSSRNDLYLFDASTGKRLNEPEGHVEAITSVAVSHDDKYAATTSMDGVLIVTELASGNTVARFSPKGDADRTNAIAFSRDSKVLFRGGGDFESSGFLSAVNVATGEELWSVDLEKAVKAISTPNDQRIGIALGGHDVGVGTPPESTLSLRDARNGGELAHAKARGLVLGFRKFDGKNLIAFDRNGVVAWSLKQEAGVKAIDYTGHQVPNNLAPLHDSFAFSPTEQIEATSALFDPRIVIRKADGSVVKKIEIRDSSSNRVAFSPGGRLIAVSSSIKREDARKGAQIRIYDLATSEPVARFQPGHRGPCDLCFTHDGHRLLSGHADGTVLVWDTSKIGR